MAIKISGTTVIDDSRNAVNLISANVSTTFNTSTANVSTVVTGNTLTLSTGTGSNSNVVISPNGSEKVRITNTGNIIISRTGDGNQNLSYLSNATGHIFAFNHDPTNPKEIYFQANTANNWFAAPATALPKFIFSVAGNDIFAITNTSVGIRTTNPTSNLHVVGNANITLGINTSTLNATTVNAATILNAVGANLSNAVLKTGDTMTGSLNFNFSGSNVSIQQQNDLAVIEMGGANGAFIDMKSPNSDDFDFRILTIQGSTSFVSNNAAQVVAFSGANVNFDSGTLFVDSVGNEIGIGTTNPTSNLHVVGNANITLGINTSTLNATTVNTTTLLATTANITTGNVTTLFASGATINGKLNVNNDLNVTGNIYLNGNTTYINVSTYTVDDPLIYLAANNNLTDTVDMGFMGGKNTSGTYSHTGLVRDATDAKWKLFDGLPEEGHIGNIINFNNTYLATLVANVEANTLTVINGVSGNVNFDSGTLFVDSVANEVGIGTTNPTSNLHVVGNANITLGINTSTINATTVNAVTFVTSTGANVSNAVLKTGDTMTGNLIMSAATINTSIANISTIVTGNALTLSTGTGSNSNVVISANGTEYVRVTNVGNVGIGTTSPTSTLHIVNSTTSNAFVVESGSSLANTRFRIADGYLNYGGSGPIIGGGSTYAKFQISGYGDGTIGTNHIGFAINGYLPNGAGSFIQFNRSNNSTVGSHTSVISGDQIGRINWSASDGTNFIRSSEIRAEVDGTPATNSMPGRLTFATTSSGAASSTERMRIDSNGNVSIGTTSTTRKLDLFNSGTTTTDLIVRNGTVTYSTFVDSGAGYTGTTTNHPLLFFANNTEKMRILADGNVAIGTTSSAYKLYVNDTAATGAGLYVTGGGQGGPIARFERTVGATGSFVEINSSGNNPQTRYSRSGFNTVYWSIGVNGNNELKISNSDVDTNDRITIANTGNVGIGTTIADQRLVVNGAIQAATTGNNGDLYLGGPNVSIRSTYSSNVMGLYTNNSERMRIVANGDVSIGTSAPVGRLHVQSSLDGPFLRLQRTGGSNIPILNINLTESTNLIEYEATGSVAPSFAWKLGGSERVRIDANGNVSIGATSSASPLRIYRAGQINVGLSVDSDAGSRIEVTANRGNGGSSPLTQAGDATLIFHAGSANTGNLVIAQWSTLSRGIRIDFNGNVAIGTSNPTSNLHVEYNDNSFLNGIVLRNQNTGSSAQAKMAFTTDAGNLNIGRNSVSGGGQGFLFLNGSFPLTFSTNSLERARIAANGWVGIGTTSPTQELDVSGNLRLFGTGNVTLTLEADTDNVNESDNPKIIFKQDGGSVSARVGFTTGFNAFEVYNETASSVRFGTNNTLRVTIDETGNVGIGTTSPTSNLHVIGTANITSNLVVGGAITENTNGTFYNVATQFDIGTAPNQIPLNQYLGTMAFQDAAGIAVGEMSVSGNTNFDSGTLFVDTINNRIGISTITPSANLHVHGSSILGGTTGSGRRIDVDSSGRAVFIYNDNSLANQITLDNLDSNANTDHGSQILWRLATNASSTAINAGRISVAKQQVWSSTGSTQDAYMAFSTISDGNLSERMRITDVGNVGIGTTAPLGRLHVSGGDTILDNNRGLRWRDTSGNANNNFLLQSDNNFVYYNGSNRPIWSATEASSPQAVFGAGTGIRTTWDASSNTIVFATSASERMRIASDGSVGIGTSTPAYKLDVSGQARATTSFLVGTGAGTQAGDDNLIRPTSTNAFLNVKGGAGRAKLVLGNDGVVLASGTTDQIAFHTNAASTTTGNERMRIDLNGNVSIGTTTTTYKLEVNGSFAATTKSFLIDHPTKPGMKLRHGSLEGPENGVYVRGKLVGNVIDLPDYWVGLVDEESITVNLTPIGKHQKLYVECVEGNKVYISNDSMFSSDINCYYTVFAERKDVDKLVVEY